MITKFENIKMKKTISALLGLLFFGSVFAQKGYNIKVKVPCLPNSTISLGYHLGDKQYIKEELTSNAEGEVVFKNDTALHTGLYLIIFPSKHYVEFIVEEQNFSLDIPCENGNLVLSKDPLFYSKITVNNSPQNKSFFNYLTFLQGKRDQKKELNNTIEQYKKNPDKKKEVSEAEDKLTALDGEVDEERKKLIKNYKGKMLSKLLLAQNEVKIPESDAKLQETYGENWQFYYYRDHFWDNIDFNFSGLLYSPILYSKADFFIEKLTEQTPDAVFDAVDLIIQKTKGNKEVFKYFVIEMLNRYAKTKKVCFDAVYVRLVNKYYASGEADWVEKEQLEKILDNAKALEGILCGAPAPDIKAKVESEASPSLHKVKAKYTILLLWDADCGNCKKEVAELKKVYAQFKDKGVEIYAVDVGDDKEKWQQYCAKESLTWINLYKDDVSSNVMKDYDVTGTPTLFLLDENKAIMYKRIDAKTIASILASSM